MGEWTPVIRRGTADAWIGVLASGALGIGTAEHDQGSLVDRSFVPMWPFLEQDLAEVLARFRAQWDALAGGGVACPEQLLELTVASAVEHGSGYWKEAAAAWLVDMTDLQGFDRTRAVELMRLLAADRAVSQRSRHRLWHELGKR